MKKKVQHKQPRKPCIIYYDSTRHGWVVQGTYKPVFAKREDLENYCRNKLGRLPILDPSIKKKAKKLPVVIVDGNPKPFMIYAGTFGRQ
jgi:hypothetical protein